MKKLKSILKNTGKAVLAMFTFLTVAGGITGLAATLINPVNLWWQVAPVEINYFNYIITYTMVLEYLEFLQTLNYFVKT